jgi:hypothetical protein
MESPKASKRYSMIYHAGVCPGKQASSDSITSSKYSKKRKNCQLKYKIRN